MTCKQILLFWLKENNGNEIAHHIVDGQLPDFGKVYFGKLYSSATYHRNFCWIKADEKLLEREGLILEPVLIGAGKVNRWRVKFKQLISNS